MRCLFVVSVLTFVVPAFGQVERMREISPSLTPFAVIVEQLQKAQASSSNRVKRKTLLQVRGLVEQLPKSPVSAQLREKIDRALRLGTMTDEAEEAIDEAIEIAKAADKILRQPPPSVDPETAQATLLRVLSSAEFRDHWAPVRRLLQRISRWLEKPLSWVYRQLAWLAGQAGRILRPVLEWLAKIVEALGAWFMHWFQLLMSISPILAWTIVVTVGAIVLTSLALAILKWWRVRQKAIAQTAVAEALIMPEQLLHEAEIAARSGDYLTALRKAYRALLLLLDRIGLIRFREQRTNWEYLAEVRKKAPADFSRRFQEATNIFDICFYARKFATANEFVTVKQLAEETRQKAQTLLDLTSTPKGSQ
ncbi:MAG: DUF4129 domain-containing protein [Armatimonadetes bacterium]|nr:DUF4129 domain-containing protein [Armatimonadota bacterium]